MYNKDDILTLNNNEDYLVLEKINIEGNNYLVLINNADDKDNVAIVKEVIKNDKVYLNNISDTQEFDKILKYLAKENEEEILKILGN